MLATVIAAHGRQYWVSTDDGRRIACFPRGKKSEVACGDRVELSLPSADQGCIERIEPRKSLLYRSNDFKQKLIAANLSQVVVVVATEPPFSDAVLTRCLIAAENQNLSTLIVLNKCDIHGLRDAADKLLGPFEKLGYRVLRIAATEDVSQLQHALTGHSSVLVGQSGMGKSTLINALIPGARAATREISTALQSGKHTTTHATLYPLADPADPAGTGWLIDSPGLQEFGLSHLSPGQVEQAMPEFRALIGRCRFRNCRHDREPGCAIADAVASGNIDRTRYAVFKTLTGGA